nr:MAG TPA: N-terminal glutamine amidase [Caudoviricetes sp.]
MLKIKDNVDLNELKKFGFKYTICEDWHNFDYDDFEISLGDERQLNIEFTNCYCEDNINKFIEFLYDLIQSGLVEKV